MNGKKAKRLRKQALREAGPSRLREQIQQGEFVDVDSYGKKKRTGVKFTVRGGTYSGQRRRYQELKRGVKD